ncbi:MAG TPA: prolyl oligopeptidase family serine peptidase [Candidatus Dormibacteraeota bacterium]|nr:prolyl oligopeptidase family serine peptidase [Candidatus Dormibacteraeota bacterium]
MVASPCRSLFLAALSLVLVAQAAPARVLPPTPRRPVTDTYFGTRIVDNYRWIEKVDRPEVKRWLKAQADYSNEVIARIPGRDSLLNDFVRLDAMRPANIASVQRKNGRYFYRKTLPSENVGRLFYREKLDGPETLLFDPTEGAGGKSTSFTFYQPSEDGKRVAVGVAQNGSETATIRILNVDTRTLEPESISPVWIGVGGWTRDGSGFTYNRLNAGDVHDQNRELNTTSYLHLVGTDPSKDRTVLSAAKYPELGMKPQDIPIVSFSDDFQYLFGAAASVQNELTMFVAPASDLLSDHIHWKPLLVPEDQVVLIVAHGDRLFLLSHKDAPRYRILETSLTNPDIAHAAVVMPEGKETIDGLDRTKNYLLATTSDGINNKVFLHAYDKPAWTEVPLPRTGTVAVGGFDITSDDAQAVITSWSKPTERYEFSSAGGTLSLSPLNVAVSYPGTEDITVEEVEAPAPDGTMVPLSIVYNKRLARDGTAPCYLSGYGAYGFSSPPYFGLMNLALIDRGVIVATAHVRGGGEKGFDWYHAGFKTTKPNTWKDFIACGEYLVKNKYTSPAHLFGEGSSAGGILIGRAITERPDLFAAAVCNVPCANALRMENTPNGPINTPEFGTVKDSTEWRALLEMDALHHVNKGVKYPAVMCVGGANDPRVIVWQPAKFAAALQNATGSGKPVLLQVNYDNGHFTEDKKVAFRDFANMYAFCLWQTGDKEFQPKLRPKPRHARV